MTAPAPPILALKDARDNESAGGKALNLGKLIRAGFNVPDGFVVTTSAYRMSKEAGEGLAPAVREELIKAYNAMGAPPVAVRSSATAEDMSAASMAGQYETFLDVCTETELIEAVTKCWASLDSPRTRAYLKEQGIDLAAVAMAVVVQRLVPADVAGVLFTANPRTGSRTEMLVEASWGLGEAVVSGMVQPDVHRVDKSTGRVLESRIAEKDASVTAKGASAGPVDKNAACLSPDDLDKLWRLGLKVLATYDGEQDLEWAISKGELFLLQSRAVTTLEDADAYAELLEAERARLRELRAAGRGPWVIHNIAETLPHPTPLTLSVIKKFMSGCGGFGKMHRIAGFEPSPKVETDGFIESIAGKLHMDVALAGEMFLPDFPFAYDVDLLRRSPNASQQPPTVPTGSLRESMAAGRKLAAAMAKMDELSKTLANDLETTLVPEFTSWVETEKKVDLGGLSEADLEAKWRERETKVLDEFGAWAFLPGLVCGKALEDLKAFLDESFWDEDPEELANLLSSAHAPDKTLMANAALYKIATGEGSVDEWLAAYGHRAPDEFDLASPRWRERPDELVALADRLKSGPDPMSIHATHDEKVAARLADLAKGLSAADARRLSDLVEMVRRYMPYREDGKFYLMLGYDLLRDAALEIGRRTRAGDDVFMLTRDEMLAALKSKSAPEGVAAARKVARRAEARIALPGVIDTPEIDALGSPEACVAGAGTEAFAISTGVASGPARVVRSVASAGDLGTGYVLVCPSTDPSWTPLFVNAVALVLERGGTLSHGAVVAREMGIPAVVLPGACDALTDGETVTVDGRCGAVVKGDASADAGAAREPGPDDTTVDRTLTPPVPGARERLCNRLMAAFGIGWIVVIATAFLLPEPWLYRPLMNTFDAIFWPIMTSVGKPGLVALVAGFFAVIIMIGQRLITDNARLVEAKRRMGELRKAAAAFPKDAPRYKALSALAGGVQTRTLIASLVPLAIALGPMIMTFMWFPERMPPGMWNPAPDMAVTVTAYVDADAPGTGHIEAPDGLVLADLFEVEQPLQPIRPTLDELYKKWNAPEYESGLPPEVHGANMRSLRAFLDAPLPDQKLVWSYTSRDGKPGRFPIAVAVGEDRLEVATVLGDACPPEATAILNDPGHPLKQVELTYQTPTEQLTFWVPFSFINSDWDAGWLLTYLVAYLPLMLLLRWLLKLP